MSKGLKIGLLIGFVVVGLAFVGFKIIKLDEFTAGLGIYLASILTYETQFNND